MVPMVEPEVLLEGDHSIERCYEVSEATLRALFAELYEQRVVLEGTILKASMVLTGNDRGRAVAPRHGSKPVRIDCSWHDKSTTSEAVEVFCNKRIPANDRITQLRKPFGERPAWMQPNGIMHIKNSRCRKKTFHCH